MQNASENGGWYAYSKNLNLGFHLTLSNHEGRLGAPISDPQPLATSNSSAFTIWIMGIGPGEVEI